MCGVICCGHCEITVKMREDGYNENYAMRTLCDVPADGHICVYLLDWIASEYERVRHTHSAAVRNNRPRR